MLLFPLPARRAGGGFVPLLFPSLAVSEARRMAIQKVATQKKRETDISKRVISFKHPKVRQLKHTNAIAIKVRFEVNRTTVGEHVMHYGRAFIAILPHFRFHTSSSLADAHFITIHARNLIHDVCAGFRLTLGLF